MTLGERLKTLRKELGFSQDVFTELALISLPGLIKVENGRRGVSEKLIHRLLDWLVENRHVSEASAKALRQELLTLKYLRSGAPFLRRLAEAHAAKLTKGNFFLKDCHKVQKRQGKNG